MLRFRFTIRSPFVLRILWLGYWAAMAAAMHSPVPSGMRLPVEGGDKVLHGMMYFLLALLGGRVRMAGAAGLSAKGIAGWGAVYALYAAIDECTQPWTGRHASVGDWIADVLGILIASSILSTQIPQSSESAAADGAAEQSP